MEKTKPVTLNSISFAHRGTIYVTEPIAVIFERREDMERHITQRKIYWSDITGLDLETAPQSCETLVREEVQFILKLVCEKTGVDYKAAKSKLRDPEYVEARRIAANIAKGRKVGNSVIARAFDQNHATIHHYIKTFNNYCETKPEYRSAFVKVEDYVLISMAGSYTVDGSGKKINNNENEKISRDRA